MDLFSEIYLQLFSFLRISNFLTDWSDLPEKLNLTISFYRFTSVLFFNVLLPPIILDAAYSLYDRDFLNNLGAIVQFAIIGTLFNVFSIGYILKLFHSYGIMGEFKMTNEDGEEIIHDFSLIQCFIFR